MKITQTFIDKRELRGGEAILLDRVSEQLTNMLDELGYPELKITLQQGQPGGAARYMESGYLLEISKEEPRDV